MEFVDYYKVLELDKSASEGDVKKAYRKQARKYHPDLNPNDNAAKLKFQQINEANEVLSDPVKRKKYDSYGKDWKHAEEFEKAGRRPSGQQETAGSSAHESFGGDHFSDFFESMFGGSTSGSGRRTQFRGQDFNAELKLDLKDVYQTHKQTLTVNGKNIRLTIPAGVENDQTIRIPDMAALEPTVAPQEICTLRLPISNQTKFKREGNNLLATVDLDLYTAVLGGEITIDTFDGKAKLIVKPETQNDTKVKLKGKGFPVYKKEGEFWRFVHNVQNYDAR